MPATADDDEFSFVCPYMMLWDVSHLGASTAAIQMAVQNDGFDGSAGSTVDMEAWGEYEAETFTAEDNGDGAQAFSQVSLMYSTKTTWQSGLTNFNLYCSSV